jgi:hypothetical protein
MKKMIFICSPYRGNVVKNIGRAKRYARFVARVGHCPVAPHLFFPQFLCDDKPEERIEGINLGVEMMQKCEQLWIFGSTISQGMAYELEKAKEMSIPVRMFDTECNSIDVATLKIDDRVDDDFRKAVDSLKFV